VLAQRTGGPTMARRKIDLYQSVTDHIVSTIENLSEDDHLVMPWHRSGHSGLPTNIESGNPYNGINILSLWVAAIDRGFTSNIWGTYRQWQKADAQVRKGEKSTLVIFYKEYLAEGDNGQEETQRFAKASWAFNVAQVEGYEIPEPEKTTDPMDRIRAVDAYVSNTKARIFHGGDMACYRPATDTISMPNDQAFFDTKTGTRTQNYYAILLHELTHWTKGKSRCDRDMAQRFGDVTYAMEELVAELGAAFQCAELGISSKPRPDHAQYLAHWMSVMMTDKKAIFTAAAKASEAVTFIKDLQ
jgi:antirestriction protein ArdC